MRKSAVLIVSIACLSLIASNTDPRETGKSKAGRDRRPASKPTSQSVLPAVDVVDALRR